MTPTETPQAEIDAFDAFMESLGATPMMMTKGFWSVGKHGYLGPAAAAFWYSVCKQREVAARLQVIEWLEADLKRLDSRNWSMDTLALDTLVGSGRADDYQKSKRQEIVEDRRAAHALYAILNNYKGLTAVNQKGAKDE